MAQELVEAHVFVDLFHHADEVGEDLADRGVPRDVSPFDEDGRVYVVRFSSGDAGEAFSAHLMPPLEGDAHRAAWMAEKGCKAQALAVLAAIGAGEEL